MVLRTVRPVEQRREASVHRFENERELEMYAQLSQDLLDDVRTCEDSGCAVDAPKAIQQDVRSMNLIYRGIRNVGADGRSDGDDTEVVAREPTTSLSPSVDVLGHQLLVGDDYGRYAREISVRKS